MYRMSFEVGIGILQHECHRDSGPGNFRGADEASSIYRILWRTKQSATPETESNIPK